MTETAVGRERRARLQRLAPNVSKWNSPALGYAASAVGLVAAVLLVVGAVLSLGLIWTGWILVLVVIVLAVVDEVLGPSGAPE